jgi:copper chaperone
MATEKASFKVVGLHCITSKPIIGKQLKHEKGINRISIDYMTDNVVVEFDPSLLTKDKIKTMLDKSGYKFVRVANRPF